MMCRKRRGSALWLAVSTAAAVFVPEGRAASYSLLDLGTLGGAGSRAYDINDAGQVVGSSVTTGGITTAFRTAPNSPINPLTDSLGMLAGGTASNAYSINNAGQTVGDTSIFGGDRAYRYGSSMNPLGTLGGDWSYAFGINDLGHVVGGSAVSRQSTSATQAFLYNGSQMFNLGYIGGNPGGQDSYGYSINNSGQVVGYSSAANWQEHAFLWTPDTPNGTTGTMIDIGGLGGGYSYAFSINDSGHVVGGATTPAELAYHAFLRTGGSNIDLSTLGGSFSEAYDINNCGQVVGSSDDALGQTRAFIWSNGVMQDLNALLVGTTGWTLQSARAINTNGQIVGYGLNPLGEIRAFLLTPMPSTTGWRVDSDGVWGESANWEGGVPTGINAIAMLGQVITAPRTITVDGECPVGTINFDSATSYTIAGAGSLVLDTSANDSAINVVSGSHTIAVPIVLNEATNVAIAQYNSTLDVSAGIDGSGLVKSGAGTLVISGPQTWAVGATLHVTEGLLRLNSDAGPARDAASIDASGGDVEFHSDQRLVALSIGDGRSATVADDGSRVLRATEISVSGRLDLRDNQLITGADIGSWDGSAYTGVTGLIAAGRNGGTWDGNGIVTSMSDASGVLTTLAVAVPAVPMADGMEGSASGAAAEGAIVLYTWGGDADLDRDLDGDDYFWIDSTIETGGGELGYRNGDFNYDGVISGDDYFIIDSNIAFAQANPNYFDGPSGLGLRSVPEPSAAALLVTGMGAMMRRRRVKMEYRLR